MSIECPSFLPSSDIEKLKPILESPEPEIKLSERENLDRMLLLLKDDMAIIKILSELPGERAKEYSTLTFCEKALKNPAVEDFLDQSTKEELNNRIESLFEKIRKDEEDAKDLLEFENIVEEVRDIAAQVM